MTQTKKELKDLLAAANEKLTHYYEADKSFTAAFDQTLDRLEVEYNERMKLQDQIAELKRELSKSAEENKEAIRRLTEMEKALSVSLERLRTIKAQAEDARKMLAQDTVSPADIQKNLTEIAKTADVQMIPVPSLAVIARTGTGR